MEAMRSGWRRRAVCPPSAPCGAAMRLCRSGIAGAAPAMAPRITLPPPRTGATAIPFTARAATAAAAQTHRRAHPSTSSSTSAAAAYCSRKCTARSPIHQESAVDASRVEATVTITRIIVASAMRLAVRRAISVPSLAISACTAVMAARLDNDRFHRILRSPKTTDPALGHRRSRPSGGPRPPRTETAPPSMNARLLIVDRDARYREWLRHHLGVLCPEGTITTFDMQELDRSIGSVTRGDFDLLLLAASFGESPADPRSEGLERLRQLRALPAMPAIIVIAEDGNELTAVRAIQLGAIDYLPKRLLTPERLRTAVQLALRRKELREAGREVLKESQPSPAAAFAEGGAAD